MVNDINNVLVHVNCVRHDLTIFSDEEGYLKSKIKNLFEGNRAAYVNMKSLYEACVYHDNLKDVKFTIHSYIQGFGSGSWCFDSHYTIKSVLSGRLHLPTVEMFHGVLRY